MTQPDRPRRARAAQRPLARSAGARRIRHPSARHRNSRPSRLRGGTACGGAACAAYSGRVHPDREHLRLGRRARTPDRPPRRRVERRAPVAEPAGHPDRRHAGRGDCGAPDRTRRAGARGGTDEAARTADDLGERQLHRIFQCAPHGAAGAQALSGPAARRTEADQPPAARRPARAGVGPARALPGRGRRLSG